MSDICEELRVRRQLARVTQSGVAQEVGLTQPGLSRIENGLRTPSPALAERIRRAIDGLAARGARQWRRRQEPK